MTRFVESFGLKRNTGPANVRQREPTNQRSLAGPDASVLSDVEKIEQMTLINNSDSSYTSLRTLDGSVGLRPLARAVFGQAIRRKRKRRSQARNRRTQDL
jgi:hypothetical protein